MELSTQSFPLSITDAKIAKVTTNTTTDYAIDAYIDLPGLKSIDVTAKTVTKEATAGFDPLSTFTLKQGFDLKFENVVVDLATLALINGSVLTKSGTSPNQVNTLIDKGTDVPSQFNLHFKTDLVDGAANDLHIEYFIVKGLMDIVPKSDDFYTCSFTGSAVARLKDKAYRAITQHETATAITGTIA